MKLALQIAFRYLFAKKSYHAINVISAISVAGVMVTTMSLVVVLSVFNGFDDLIRSMYHAFDPDLKIVLAQGKNFTPPAALVQQLHSDPEISSVSVTLQEHALARHRDYQDLPLLKGVDENYIRGTELHRYMSRGTSSLEQNGMPYALLGQTVAINLQADPDNALPVEFFLLRGGSGLPLDPSEYFHRITLPVAGVFALEEEANQYVLLPIETLRQLTGKDSVADAIEIRLRPEADAEAARQKIAQIAGDRFAVKNLFQQKELFYKIMNYEKWAGFMILVFILLVASFNVTGTLSMLILEKERDMHTLRNLGATDTLIRKVFLWEGMLISLAGALGGILLGVLLCWLQQQYGLLKLQGDGNFIISAYPVRLRAMDLFYTLMAVGITGWFTTWYPVHKFFKRF